MAIETKFVAAAVDLVLSEGGGALERDLLHILQAQGVGPDAWDAINEFVIIDEANRCDELSETENFIMLPRKSGQLIFQGKGEKTLLQVSWEMDIDTEHGVREPEKMYVEIFAGGQRIMEEFVSSAMEAVELQNLVEGAEA